MRLTASLLLILLAAPAVWAQSLSLLEEDGEVWVREQVITGVVEGVDGGTGVVTVGNRTWAIEPAEDGTFATTVVLGEGLNSVIAMWEVGPDQLLADTLELRLGYVLRPEAELVPSVEGRTVTLAGRVLENPDSLALAFAWEVDPENPSPVAFATAADSLATVVVPETAAPGTYFFNWTVTDAHGDAFRARTFVVVDSTGIDPFDIATEHAPWVDEAVIYQVTPYNLVPNGRFSHVIERIPEIADLGVNTLWVQPVFGTAGRGQGYDITDYFAVRSDYGSEQELRTLISTARAHGMRVLFDFVPNHSSIEHPYAQDAILHGARSQYHDFYMREGDGAPYSRHYNVMDVGAMRFIYYFWTDLVTFDYANPGVQRFIVEASRYWIENFDIDGYRFDAVWGPFARNPQFAIEWRHALKRVKPEMIMLAEDKATRSEDFPPEFPSVFDAFDVAYDWTDEVGYISRWAFQTGQPDQTIFNRTVGRTTVNRLRSAIKTAGMGLHPDAVVLRYLENNDTPRFIANHSEAQTRMAATLMFALPGIPMIYQGQEVGFERHPYQTFAVYQGTSHISRQHKRQLFPFYHHLVNLREAFPALREGDYQELEVEGQDPMFAFRRSTEREHVIAVLNTSVSDGAGAVLLPAGEMGLGADAAHYLTDLFTGEVRELSASELDRIELDVIGHTTRLFALGPEAAQVPVTTEPEGPLAVTESALGQNYPNPFHGGTRIAFDLPSAGDVTLRVYDLLGREVRTLVNAALPAGRHEVAFDGAGLASGTYLYRLQYEGRIETRAMTLTR